MLVNVVNIIVGNDYKSCSLGGDVVASNNGFDQEYSLKGMSSLVDDSQQTFPIYNVEHTQHVSLKGDLAHLSGLSRSNYFSKVFVLNEKRGIR